VPETYAPVLLRRRATLLSRVTGTVYMTKIDFEQPFDLRQTLMRSFIRPWALLFLEPIVLIISVSQPSGPSLHVPEHELIMLQIYMAVVCKLPFRQNLAT
jgi:hypothetical protein